MHCQLQAAREPADAALVPKVHVNLGITLEADGRLLAACEHYRAAAARNAGHFRARKLLGSALYALGDLPAARDELAAALELQPAYADAYCDLGAHHLCLYMSTYRSSGYPHRILPSL